MGQKENIIDFLLNPAEFLRKENYQKIRQESRKYLVTPLKVIAFMVAVSGLFAMVFEVRHYQHLQLEIYFTRLFATLIAFLILVFTNAKNSEKYSTALVHILLLTIIVSSAIMIYLMPKTLVVNSQIVGLVIFTSALFLSWEVVNQIIAAIYYNLVFSLAILLNDQKIYILPNTLESLLFVLFMSLLSILGSAINFKLRLQIAEKSIQTEKSEQKYKSIFNNALIGIYQTTLDGKIITANDAMAKIIGYEKSDDVIGKDILAFYKNPNERDHLIELLNEKGTVENLRLTLIRKNFDEIYLKVNARLVELNGTDKKIIEGNLQDITEQVKAEQIRDEYQESLKKEKEKSEKLAAEAMKLSQVKSRFLANLSHEVRTPLNSIIGLLSIIEDGNARSEDEVKQFISTARSSAESLLEVINAILDLSKIEAGKIELEKLNFNLRKVIDQAVMVIQQKAREKGIGIIEEIPSNDELNFVGDPTRIRQIYINLLSNAVKFTDEGEIRIKVSTEVQNSSRIKVISSIEDTGIGIPADKISELFKPFSQVDGSEGKKFGGTGLGLVICKEFLNLMEGDIKVESVEGVGTKFSFHFFVELALSNILGKKNSFESDRQKTLVDSMHEQLDQELVEQRKKFRILLAEDNLINQKVAIRTLTSFGYQIDAVLNGEQAVSEHKSKNYDLILMDIQMPEVDGYTATKLIRKLDSPLNSVPIIALTAHALLGDKEKCLVAGMNDYISKPVVAKEIVGIIDKYLGIHKNKPQGVKKEMEKTSSLFDFERLNQVSLGDKEFEKDLLGDYFKDVEIKLETLKEFVLQRNFKKIQELAHTLKGSSYSVGARAIGDEALGIELSAKSLDIESVEERMIKLVKVIRESKELFKDVLAD
ncbi:ATP-binding protein [Ignavibacterium sp.]|jgi:PAS domain S-box-containing protein|uniref:hybrid sensor histidine kinase/response regulator n=1 Tax=Ignavibacterium sp. TaxID=2651167 RepID=UPI0025C3C918|nr:ATP-binding protein [Ignavibacterium sp.]